MMFGDPFHRLLTPSEGSRLGHILLAIVIMLIVFFLLSDTAAGALLTAL